MVKCVTFWWFCSLIPSKRMIQTRVVYQSTVRNNSQYVVVISLTYSSLMFWVAFQTDIFLPRRTQLCLVYNCVRVSRKQQHGHKGCRNTRDARTQTHAHTNTHRYVSVIQVRQNPAIRTLPIIIVLTRQVRRFENVTWSVAWWFRRRRCRRLKNSGKQTSVKQNLSNGHKSIILHVFRRSLELQRPKGTAFVSMVLTCSRVLIRRSR